MWSIELCNGPAENNLVTFTHGEIVLADQRLRAPWHRVRGEKRTWLDTMVEFLSNDWRLVLSPAGFEALRQDNLAFAKLFVPDYFRDVDSLTFGGLVGEGEVRISEDLSDIRLRNFYKVFERHYHLALPARFDADQVAQGVFYVR